jgi:YrbI family 3-deoxy-D-manno-octulosonate 8-phosphate phosphatase
MSEAIQNLTKLLPERPALLVLDFDGVLTDNHVYVDEHGTESVRCSKEDSMGLSQLRKAGFPVLILSSEKNAVVQKRAAKLQIPCISGVDDKVVMFRQLVAERGLRAADVVFVGNDVNDLGCLAEAGCGLATADAHPKAKAAARGALSRCGGLGAVREVCDAVLEILERTEARKDAA